MVSMTSQRVIETVSVAPRPSCQLKSVCSLVEVAGTRRHKEQVSFRPVLAPIKYADTAYVYINNTRRRFVSKTFYEPRLRPRQFAETTYASPATLEERFVSRLDHHAAGNRTWFKTRLEVKAKRGNFKSSRHLVVDSGSIVGSPTRNGYDATAANNGSSHSGGNLNAVDENMNDMRVPAVAEEKYDPGASQVYIPKPGTGVLANGLDRFAGIEDQILLDFPGNDVDYLRLNGQTDGYSDL